MERDFDPNLLEWMDRPQPVSEELKRDLQNLATLNRLFGSYALIIRLVSQRVKKGSSCRILDLATGSADIPRALIRWARKSGVDLQIDAVDCMDATLHIAEEWSAGYPEIRLLKGDARTFVSDMSYDGVLCSLALHHFSRDDAISVLRNMRKLARNWMVAADLERSRFGQACIWLLTAVWMREPMTRDDARISIRRSFSFDEFYGLAKSAGWEKAGHSRFPVARQALWMDRR